MAHKIKPWVKCSGCDDFYCTVHEVHAFDCDCPEIEAWIEAGLDPYLKNDAHAVNRFLEAHVFAG